MRKAIAVIFVAFLFALLAACGGVATSSKAPDNTGGQTGTGETGGSGGSITAVNHIIYVLQENRSFDSYFGHLNDYRVAHGLSADVNGLPPVDCGTWKSCQPGYQTGAPQQSFHFTTTCTFNLSPAWTESHVDFNKNAPTSDTPTMDGFAYTAGGFAVGNGLWDVEGRRAMGYFTDRELPYYYFMATRFAMGDAFFAPVPARTQPNRMYSYAATSQGHAWAPTSQLSAKTIWDLLQAAGVSWKIYYTDSMTNGVYCDAAADITCPVGDTYFSYFTSYDSLKSHLAPVAQYFQDVANGTLPSVALIESGYQSNRDEHPLNNAQTGAAYVARIVNALMDSPSWKDSVFFWTFDEAGAMYDHVPPVIGVPNPDGLPPSDLRPTDICVNTPGGPGCDFTRTGFRVPNLVISPFARRGFVSHTLMDYTAILKFIETRFNLPNLTKRDAAQPDMTEFFNFANPPNATPPGPGERPSQPSGPNDPGGSPCYFDHLP